MLRLTLTLTVSLLFVCAATLTLAALAGPAKCYDWVTRDKIRGGYMSVGDLGPQMPRIKTVGINLLMPKFGGLSNPPNKGTLKLLRQWGGVARQNGLHLMPVFNFRGGETEKLLSDRREVTVAGGTMKLTPCPADEQFWTLYIQGRFVYLAEHATELGLHGAILDPEMYGADHCSYTGVCYCADCLREFCQDTDREVPAIAAAQRATWLKQNDLERAFEKYLEDRIKGFCERIEREVHAKNPDFLLGTLHPDITGPFTRGLAMGLGTEKYPLLGFTEMTYSPGYTEYVEKQQQTFAAMPAYVLFVPGLWQQQFPSENLAEQYYTCAAHSAGYWVYTFESMLEDVSKLPGYQLREPQDRYWEALKTANGELDKLMASGGTYVSVLKVRPFDPPLSVLNLGGITIEALAPAPDAQPLSLGAVTRPRLRYRSPLFILGKAGEPVTVKVTNLQLANYLPGTQWAVLGPDGKQLQEGHMKVKESREVRFTPGQDGVLVLLAESGQNSHDLQVTSGQRHAFIASEKQRFTVNGVFGRMYFYVLKGVTQFSSFVKAEGQATGRGGKLTITGPDNKPAAHVEGDLGTLTEIPVTVPAELQGRVWCLSAEDVTNDLTVYFSANTSPYVTPDPRKVLTAKR